MEKANNTNKMGVSVSYGNAAPVCYKCVCIYIYINRYMFIDVYT